MARIARPRRRASGRPGTRSRTYASEFETAQPAARRRRTTYGNKAAAAVLLVGALVLGYDLLSQSHFRIQQVEVVGVELLPADEIAAQVDIVGQSIFAVRAAAHARQLLAQFPAMAQATVRCTLPNRVTVKVREHDVALVWESGGRYWWIGQGGRVLGETTDPKGRAVLHDIKGLAPDPQGYVLGVPWDYTLAIARALPELRHLDYALEEGLLASWGAAQWPVFLGYEGDAGAQAAVLRALDQQLAARRIEVDYVDLRNQGRPIIKPR